MAIEVGTVVERKRDGARGAVVKTEENFTGSHPGRVFRTLYGVRLDDDTLRAKAGGIMVGDAGWLRSYFKLLKACRGCGRYEAIGPRGRNVAIRLVRGECLACRQAVAEAAAERAARP